MGGKRGKLIGERNVLADGGQQRMRMRVHYFERHGYEVSIAEERVAARGGTHELAAFDDVGPMEGTRVWDGEQHLRVAQQRGQRLERLGRVLAG